MKRERYFFSSVTEKLRSAPGLQNLLHALADIDQINHILQQHLPELAQIGHCGAIDYANDLIVIYANSNAAFHRLNQNATSIQDELVSNGVHLAKLLIKVRPGTYQPSPKPRHLTSAERSMLQQFGAAIGRPELAAKGPGASEASEPDWLIKL